MPETQRIALVTGVGKQSGLGFAICNALLNEGFEVFLAARSLEQAEAVAADLDRGEFLYPIALDITKPEDIDAVRATLEQRDGQLDVLVNNAAAMSPWGELASTADLSAAKAVFDTTLFGTWAMCQAMLPLVRTSPSGRIVNVSSGAGSHGDQAFGLTTDNQMGTSYAVSKAALNALTVKLAREETSDTVKINAVCPGFTATFEGGEAMGARPPSESTKGIVWAATLPEDGPTGGFFRDGKALAW